MKRLTRDKMKEMEGLLSKKDHPDAEKYKTVLEKGQANLEKYKKMTIMTQNVLRVNYTKHVEIKIHHLSEKDLYIMNSCICTFLCRASFWRAK